MDQQKTGSFLRELRKEKGLTQEQAAEEFHVAGRTISRWETGRNMPDLDIIVQLSDFYEVDLRELLDGERKSEKMNTEKETALIAVDYSNTETERYTKRIHRLLWAGAIFWLISRIITYTGLTEIYALSAISDFSEGAACGMIICGLVVTSFLGQRLRAFKERLLKKHQ